MTAPLVLGTRASQLARWQTDTVATMLRDAHPDLRVEIRVYTTSGDDQQDVPVAGLAANAFTDRLEAALLSGEIDAAVHSYKDLPTVEPAGLMIAAVPVRADVREALVTATGCTLAELPAGAIIGTSSERRAAMMCAIRPDIDLRPIRGPVDVRIEKIMRGEYDGAIFAAAGLQRIGLDVHITEYFDPSVFPPPAGQGALAVQCRSDDAATIRLLSAIDDVTLHEAVRAERRAESNTSGVA